MKIDDSKLYADLLKTNLSELPYFRGFLRAVEGRFYQNLELAEPVLDVGCGDGHFAARTFQKRIHYGIDPSFKFLKEARQYKGYEQLINGKGHRLPFEQESISTVISNSVLEHIPNVDQVLREINRILKIGGKFYLSVPNSNFPVNLSVARFFDRLGLKKLANFYREIFNKISRHYHTDAPEKWKERLSKSGFNVKEGWEYFPPESLKILEWGHFFGLPNWICKQIFKRWVLYPDSLMVKLSYKWLLRHYREDPLSSSGAYSFFIAEKKH